MSLNTLAAAASFVEAQSNKSEVDTRGKCEVAMCFCVILQI